MSLEVQLRGERLGTLFEAAEGDCRFAYAPEAVEKVGAGSLVLSTALPARPEPFGADATRAYVEGLLPEGGRRRRIARELGIDSADGFALLSKIGRDCAGAVVFLPPDAASATDEASERWLSDEELEGLIAGRALAGGADGHVESAPCASLSGERHKLALVRDETTGRWGVPSAESPSTHIVKPETGEYPDLVANEVFCMAVARCVGLPVVDTEHLVIAGRPCVVSRRFDREGSWPHATRVHQEDFCQALGFSPGGADSPPFGPDPGTDGEGDGPRFAESSGLLRAVGREEDVPVLLTAAIFNYALGNGDAHGKNFALMLEASGPRLAPLYDLTSTAVYDLPIHRGMVIAEDYDATAYLLEMDAICQECDFELDRFREMVSTTAAEIEACLGSVAEQARRESWHAPVIDDIVELAIERARGLGFEVGY